MLNPSLYAYIWRATRRDQLRICLLIALVTPLAMVPLELQRRIVDLAVGKSELWLLAVLGFAYLAVILIQGGLKYVLNLTKGRVLEIVTRDLRIRTLRRVQGQHGSTGTIRHSAVEDGTIVSMLAAESEEIGGFASESLAVPLLQIGTIAWVVGYLIWVEPKIAVLAVFIYAPQAILVPRMQKVINRLARKRTSLIRKLGHQAIITNGFDDAGALKRQTHARILIQQIFRARIAIYRHKFFLTFLGNFLDSLGPIIVLVVGGYLVIRGQTDISTLVVFISGFQRLSDPWDQLVNFYRTVSNTRVTYDLVVRALSDPLISTKPVPAGG